MTARTGTPMEADERRHRRTGAGAVVVSQLLIRTASAAGALVVGSYFVDLSAHGVPVGSLLLGVLTALSFVAELVVAPFAGVAADRRGRRVFLMLGPVLAATGILLTPGASLSAVAPSLILVAAVIAAARLLDGAGAGVAIPATLGLLADATDGDRVSRGRLTSMYELASSGGIALGAVLGPVLYAVAGLWAFALLALLYLAAAALVAVLVPRGPAGIAAAMPVRLRALRGPRLAAFLPAWIAVNAILGTWVTSQITLVLAGERTVPGQLFPGALAGHAEVLSAVLGIYVLVFSLCIVVWSFLVGRLPAMPTMLVTVTGAIVASVGLMLANHGMPVAAAIPIVVVGVFLEAGFTPAALTHLAELSSESAGDRGLIMGVYSVALGIGYLAGNVLGGLFAAWLAFDGLGWLTVLLAAFAIAALLAAMRVETRRRRPSSAPATATRITDLRRPSDVA